jgi:hypothetical protein
MPLPPKRKTARQIREGVRHYVAPETQAYLTEVGTCLHESCHAAAAIASGLPFNYVEIGGRALSEFGISEDGVSSGRISIGQSDDIEGHVFTSYAAIAGVDRFHFAPGGVAIDLGDIEQLVLDNPDAENIKARAKLRAAEFVKEHHGDIIRVAHALQVRRRLDKEDVKGIFEGVAPDPNMRRFMGALALLPRAKWVKI